MAKARVTLYGVVQGEQVYASLNHEDDCMAAFIAFTLEVNGQTYPGMFQKICQPHGTDFESEVVEGTPPIGPYKGPWNHHAFKPICEEYYRELVGRSGH